MMSKYKENECDKLVQQIATLCPSQWSGLPADCGHHIIHRGSILWRWRLMNIAPLTFEEHQMTHAGLLKPIWDWQKEMFQNHRHDLLERYLHEHNLIREEFVNQAYEYLKQVKYDLEHNLTKWEDVIKKERAKWED